LRNDILDYAKSKIHADVYNYELLSAICLYVCIINFVRRRFQHTAEFTGFYTNRFIQV